MTLKPKQGVFRLWFALGVTSMKHLSLRTLLYKMETVKLFVCGLL